jgi:VIT1/CCC1 family predicted Fe2+/Mn2+ transporter
MNVLKKEIKRYRANQQEETNAAAIYRALSEMEEEKELRLIYQRLAESEERHAQFWLEQQQNAGASAGPLKPSWQPRLLIALARRFGPQFILPTLMGVENNNSNIYQQQKESKGTSLAAEENSHKRILTALTETGSGLAGSSIARLEGRHRSAGGNALRAAVLGANDGLVSNLSLVMGVAGAELSAHSILVTGVAGLLAGAISMALGEWLSVQSSREYYQRQIDIEKQELIAHPEEEAEELALIYQAKGVAREQALAMAQQIIAQDHNALDTLAREELGIDPAELGGSAWEAAITSFLLFAVGAIIPVMPFFFLHGMTAVFISSILSGLALFGIGATITLMTGRSVWLSGLRQLAFGLLAAAVTYGIGWLVGVQLMG